MEENKEELNKNVYKEDNTEIETADDMEVDIDPEVDSEMEAGLDSIKIIKYANNILPKINDLFLEYQENDEKIALDEFIIAISTLVPQALLETDEDRYSLLEINHLINALLFNLK